MPRDDLRLDRRVVARFANVHQLAPLLHAVLRFLQERAILLGLQEGKQLLQGRERIADQADVDRIAQADAPGIGIDLDGLGLLRLGIPFQVREARADQEAACRSPPGPLRTAAFPGGRRRRS